MNSYNQAGQLTQTVSGGAETTSYTYDGAGNVVSQEVVLRGGGSGIDEQHVQPGRAIDADGVGWGDDLVQLRRGRATWSARRS